MLCNVRGIAVDCHASMLVFLALPRNASCYSRPLRSVRTCNSYWNPQDSILEEGGIDDILMGMASQIAEREDNIITEDLRGSVFGPLEFSRRDLMALNIQRGRDHGLPDYNTARRHYNLPRRTFDEINTCSCGNTTVQEVGVSIAVSVA